MLSKIFSFGNRRAGKVINDVESVTADEENRATRRPFPNLEKDEVRVLVFKDCDRKGKTLLFDSKAVVNKPATHQDGSQDKGVETEQSPRKPFSKPRLEVKPKQQHPRPSQDAKMLGEMIFGSVAMAYKGATVKVHEIRTPHQLLLSNVFALKPRIVMPNCCDGNEYLCSSGNVDSILDESTRLEADSASLSSQNSSPKDDPIFGASSKPMAVPRSSPVIIDPDEDSGFMASMESSYLGEDPSLLYTPVSSSCGSYKRRLYRSHVTSIDHSFGRKNEEPTEEISPLLRRRPKLGIGIIFHLGDYEEKSRALQGIFFAHFPLIELHMKRLGITIENACFLKTMSFSSQIIEAVDTFRSNIYDLFAAPRLKEPVWLNMMTHSSNRSQLCEKFMVQLMDCLKVGNTRSTNFFLAAVLTAVLSHHLAWVPTVMPAGASPSRAYLDKHSSRTLDLLAQSHPYNPLWAQLGDLYGAVGFPLKVARTIVVGKDPTLVDQVLNILSYFIRCSEVFEHDQRREDAALDKGNGGSHEFSGEICLHCGSSNLAEGKTVCTSHESKTCLKCKQNFEELLQNEKKEGVERSVNGGSLKRFQLEGATFCTKCDSRIHGTIMERMLCCDGLQQTSKCNHVPNGMVKVDIKHLVKNVNLVKKTTHTNMFQCYCCKDPTYVHGTLSNESTFKCYCSTGGTFHKIMENDSEMVKLVKEHNYCNNLTEKSQESQLCEHNCVSAEIDTGVQNFRHKGNQVLSVGALECTDTCISKADGCISDEIDISSVQSSVPEKIDSNETVASYGRSGSADSGIYQSPLNSPVVGYSVDFLDAVKDHLEDEQMPEELPLPRVVDVNCCPNGIGKAEEWKSYNNFGRSLFAGICDSYLPDLVLQGIEDNDFIAKLSGDLKLSLQHSVVDDPVSEAICIIADTDRWTCEVISAKRNRKQQPQSDAVLAQPVEVSNLVLSMLTSVSGLWDIKMSAEFCLMHLEDKLKEIYFKSKVFAERVRDRRRPFSRHDIAKMLSVDDNDIALLLAVASTHSLHNMAFESREVIT